MVLNEKETMVLRELQTQEQNCMDKYKKYSGEAKDPVLKDLFMELHKSEKQHHDSLKQVLSGSVPTCNCNDTSGRDYHPKATYSGMGESQDKKDDCFLATDCIGTEKMVSSEYNGDVFRFDNSAVRKLLADIQVEEQNHAEMLWNYKMVNGMA